MCKLGYAEAAIPTRLVMLWNGYGAPIAPTPMPTAPPEPVAPPETAAA
jgi:hypothetical protein